MLDILDVDVSGHASIGYDLVIARQAEWDRAVIDYVRQSKGATWQPNDANFRHILFRVISDERAIWRTTRNAIDDRQAEGQSSNHQDPNPKSQIQSGRLIQVTDEPGIVNRSYSYWSNAWLGPDDVALVFAPTNSGPVLYAVDLTDGTSRRIGPLNGYGGTGEGMYWNADGTLAVLDGPRMRRLKPITGASEVLFDISERFPGARLWQAHSSADGQVHSATVQRIVSDGAYPKLGTVVWRRGELHWFPSAGALDESQIDKSGEYLLIKEGDDNLVVMLEQNHAYTIRDDEGALGHSDMGSGFAVGEDNIHGACVRVDLRTLERRELFSTWNLGEVSIRGNRCLLSDATNRNLALVDLETGDRRVLLEHGMTGSGYESQVHGNLSPCGKVAAFVSNRTGRLELYVIVL
jgi:hypothetical protein